MQVIPVIDLQGGLVVHAVRGQRASYRPVKSRLAPDARPRSIARAFREKLGAEVVYVADLDSLAGRRPNLASLEQVAEAGLQIWIDAGLRTAEQASRWAAEAPGGAPLAGVVAALESVPNAQALAKMGEAVGWRRLVFSLDLHGGRMLAASEAWWKRESDASGPRAVWEVAEQVVAAGVRRMIVLDLADVGAGKGVTTVTLCRELRRRYPSLQLIAGGGVRDRDDLRRLADAGCDAALVASALHGEKLRAADVQTGDDSLR